MSDSDSPLISLPFFTSIVQFILPSCHFYLIALRKKHAKRTRSGALTQVGKQNEATQSKKKSTNDAQLWMLPHKHTHTHNTHTHRQTHAHIHNTYTYTTHTLTH
jgi:hypothetical protein